MTSLRDVSTDLVAAVLRVEHKLDLEVERRVLLRDLLQQVGDEADEAVVAVVTSHHVRLFLHHTSKQLKIMMRKACLVLLGVFRAGNR